MVWPPSTKRDILRQIESLGGFIIEVLQFFVQFKHCQCKLSVGNPGHRFRSRNLKDFSKFAINLKFEVTFNSYIFDCEI